MSEYTEQAENFLKTYGLEFRAVLVGNDCPMFCEDALADRDMEKLDTYPRKTHIHGKHYRCTVSGKDRGHVSFDFWNSYSDEEFNAFHYGGNLIIDRMNIYWDKHRGGKYPRSIKMPKRIVSAYDLLTCIQKSDVGTFEDFCEMFGYDTDSRRAEATYHEVRKEWRKVENFFTQDEIDALQGIQ